MSIQNKSWAQDQHILEEAFGIHLPNVIDYRDKATVGDSIIPITQPNNAIPGQFTTYLDPSIIEVLTAPCKAASIYGEAKKGDWLHDTILFTEVGYETATHKDLNTQFPQRQQFLVQTFAEWGDREVGRAALANIDIASSKRMAAIINLNYWQNQSYFFGINNLQNFGALNDPNLLPAITPNLKAAGGTSWKNATANEIYDDIKELYQQLQAQAKGIVNLDNAVNTDSPLKLVVSNEAQPYLLTANSYSGFGVMDLVKKNFPNLTQVSAPQLSTEGGELVQMFVEHYQGIDTFTCAFSEKLRSHGIVRESSAMREKLTQGSWGTILTRPILVAQMLGV